MNNNTISSDPNNLICITARCYNKAVITIQIRSMDGGLSSLSLCEKCRQEYFPNKAVGSDGNPGATPIHNNDIPLNFITKTKCSCGKCSDEATVFLEIVRSPQSGFFCEMCSIDLKIHGIAREVIVE